MTFVQFHIIAFGVSYKGKFKVSTSMQTRLSIIL